MRDYLLAAQLDASDIAPDLRAPVHGFRAWRVIDGRLRSRTTGTPWPRREAAASCRPRSPEELVLPAHAAPDVRCGCGLAAHYEPLAEVAVDAFAVMGVVRAWGAVVAERAGFRAEAMEVVALGADERWTRRQAQAVAAVASELGVDLLPAADLAEAAELYAPALPPAVRPGTALSGPGLRSAPPAPRELVVAGPGVGVPAVGPGRSGHAA